MRKRTRNSKERVEFSERTGKVCGTACRQSAMIEQARNRGLLSGWKYV
jgi:hypothetical protein